MLYFLFFKSEELDILIFVPPSFIILTHARLLCWRDKETIISSQPVEDPSPGPSWPGLQPTGGPGIGRVHLGAGVGRGYPVSGASGLVTSIHWVRGRGEAVAGEAIDLGDEQVNFVAKDWRHDNNKDGGEREGYHDPDDQLPDVLVSSLETFQKSGVSK